MTIQTRDVTDEMGAGELVRVTDGFGRKIHEGLAIEKSVDQIKREIDANKLAPSNEK